MSSGHLPEDDKKFQEVIRGAFDEPQNDTPKMPRPGLTRRGRIALASGAVILIGGGAITGLSLYSTAQERSVESAQVKLELRQAEMAHERKMAELQAKQGKKKESRTELGEGVVNTSTNATGGGGSSPSLSGGAVLGLAAVTAVVLVAKGKRKPA